MSDLAKKLEVIPKREWATSEQVLKVLEKLTEQTKAGELVSLAYVAETSDLSYVCGSTKVNNCYAMVGYLQAMALRLIRQNEEDNG